MNPVFSLSVGEMVRNLILEVKEINKQLFNLEERLKTLEDQQKESLGK